MASRFTFVPAGIVLVGFLFGGLAKAGDTALQSKAILMSSASMVSTHPRNTHALRAASCIGRDLPCHATSECCPGTVCVRVYLPQYRVPYACVQQY